MQNKRKQKPGVVRKEGVIMKSIMLKLFKKYGHAVAALALTITAMNVNSACFWINNQPELPADAKELRKF